MNKLFSFFVLCITVSICTAQVKPASKSVSNSIQNQLKAAPPTQAITPPTPTPPPPPPPPTPRSPTGPNGFGSIKIGMTKDAIEQLTEKDGVYLASPMTGYVYKYGSPVEGFDKFDAKIITPLSSERISIVLTFKADELVSLSISFEGIPGGYERSKAQITEKYGPGKEVNNRKEEQCIYKNGANFKVTNGSIISTWIDEISKDERIETRMNDWILNICPSNLRYSSVGESGVKSISIQKLQNSKEADKAKSLF